jgi:membrane protein required for colicin V production
MEAWAGIDFVIIGIIGLSVLTGLMRGFFKELVALAAWILAIWLAITYTKLVAGWFVSYIHDNTLRSAVAFIVILLCTLLAGAIVNMTLGFVLKHSGLSGADRILGMGFGFIRGVVIVSLVIVIAGMSGMNLAPYRTQSKLYMYFDPVVSWI